MNKNGFTLVELLTVIVIISLVLMIIYPSVTKILQRNSNEMYESYEKMMVEYAQISPLNGNSIIKLANLDELDKVKKECKGYVTIDHSVTPNVYKAYISCEGKYQTIGYNTSLE